MKNETIFSSFFFNSQLLRMLSGSQLLTELHHLLAFAFYLLSFRYGSAALHLHVSQSVTSRLRAERQGLIGLVVVAVDIT